LRPTIKSLAIAASIPKSVGFYDLIYHPEETVFLRHGRLSGHPTMNGKAMIVNQAVIAFCKCICSAELQARGIDSPETFSRVLEVMIGRRAVRARGKLMAKSPLYLVCRFGEKLIYRSV
jgi:hypothetical protein